MLGTIAGLCVTLSLATGTARAVASETHFSSAHIASIEDPARVTSAGVGEIATQDQLVVAAIPHIVSERDPLQTIEIPETAEVSDPRAAIIAGMAARPADHDIAGSDPSPTENYVYFGDRRVPRWVVDSILRGAEATDADPVYMMALADKESSFLSHNKAATSSAEGLFQFISSTWLEVIRSFGGKHGFRVEAEAIEVIGGRLSVPDERMRAHILGLRRNAYLSALMAGELKRRDTAAIESKLGRRINRSEYYLSHFFGVNRAHKFMNLVDDKPKQSAPRLFPAAAKANRSLFFTKSGRKTRHLSVAEVYEKIDEMIDTRIDRYEGVLGLALAEVAL